MPLQRSPVQHVKLQATTPAVKHAGLNVHSSDVSQLRPTAPKQDQSTYDRYCAVSCLFIDPVGAGEKGEGAVTKSLF